VPAQLTPDQAAFDFNPMTSPHREDPHVFYRAARERPVTFSPSIGAYMVTRHADLVTVLDDPQTYSSKAALPMIYDNPPEVVAELRAGQVPETTMVVNEDEPEHIRFRRVFDAGFTGARVRAMVPLMRERADALIDGFAGGSSAGSGVRADLVADYAIPFVQAVISAVIGFPAEDTARIQAWTDDVNMLWNMLASVQARVESARRMADYTRYLQALIDDRRAHPREDLVSDLVRGANGYQGVPDAYVHNMIRGAARVAGFDTTRDAITATVLIMLENPGVRDRILADPARAIPKLTEEALRRDAPHRGLFRITTREAELGGTLLPAGAPLLLLFGSGNRDETVFAHPDDVDLDRPNVRDHLAFGRGLHSCPGAPMARAEIRVALETLIRRLPGLRLADGYQAVYIASYFFRGLESLEVTWLPSTQPKGSQFRRECIMQVLMVCYGHPADPAAFGFSTPGSTKSSTQAIFSALISQFASS
jgi:cytochrome P450